MGERYIDSNIIYYEIYVSKFHTLIDVENNQQKVYPTLSGS